jgi:hypothetical protein
VRRRTPEFIGFIDATSKQRAAHTIITNYRAKILVIMCAKRGKFDPGEE